MNKIDPKDFRNVTGSFATGVTVIATQGDTNVHGMTANAFTSVSLDPPLILVSIGKNANTHELIKTNKKFSVNFLKEDQKEIAGYYAKKVPNPEIESKLHYMMTKDEIPVMTDSLASLACTLWETYDGGDHTLYIGRIEELEVKEGTPLIFYKGAYHNIDEGVTSK